MFADRREIEKYERWLKEDAYEEGERAGYDKGERAGNRERQLFVVIKTLKGNKLTHEEIAEYTGMNIDEVRKIAEEMKKEVSAIK